MRKCGSAQESIVWQEIQILKEDINMDVKLLSHLLMTAFHGQGKENTSNGLYH